MPKLIPKLEKVPHKKNGYRLNKDKHKHNYIHPTMIFTGKRKCKATRIKAIVQLYIATMIRSVVGTLWDSTSTVPTTIWQRYQRENIKLNQPRNQVPSSLASSFLSCLRNRLDLLNVTEELENHGILSI